jgi:DNA (cytosine-5)-methyltransferase 1
MSGVPVIDLFAGAGGFSTGAIAAGGDVRLCVEIDPRCCETLRVNHPGTVIIAEDAASLDGRSLRERACLSIKDPLVVIGGPPCQPFSKNAYWTDPEDYARRRDARRRGEETKSLAEMGPRDDKRRTFVDEYVRLLNISLDL